MLKGSILGPLLFLVYVNDMPLCLNHCEIVLYADDTVMHISSSSVSVIESKLNDDLYSLSLWFAKNYLILNISKSKFILMGITQKLSSCQGINLYFTLLYFT